MRSPLQTFLTAPSLSFLVLHNSLSIAPQFEHPSELFVTRIVAALLGVGVSTSGEGLSLSPASFIDVLKEDKALAFGGTALRRRKSMGLEASWAARPGDIRPSDRRRSCSFLREGVEGGGDLGRATGGGVTSRDREVGREELGGARVDVCDSGFGRSDPGCVGGVWEGYGPLEDEFAIGTEEGG